jgi:putative flavoprotein involved in K+ transport
MPSIDSLVIGAGPAGLAMSRCLTDAGVDHVVVERGRLGERWRTERWDSVRLLSPNWATRLPSWSYGGDDPSGYMTAAELVDHLQGYADSFDAPVHEHTTVRHVRRTNDGFTVRTDDALWRSDNVVIATGWCDRPRVPPVAAALPSDVTQLTPSTYRNPAQVPDGGVLVVGASASGVQIADELARAGRDVVLAVGHHNRLPRHYRGRDIWCWLDRLGTFAQTIDDVARPSQARVEGSLQLVGHPDHRHVDLPALRRTGVRLAGRLLGVDGHHVRFAPDLALTTAVAEGRMARVLAQIDRYITLHGRGGEPPDAEPVARLDGAGGLDHLCLPRDRIRTVLWATGFTRQYPWLQVPVLDGAGEIRQRRGMTPVPGLYVLGQRFQHRRDSNFIDGVRHDATHVAHQIATCPRRRAHVAC